MLSLPRGPSERRPTASPVGAAKDHVTNDGYTPVLLAAEEGHLDIVRFLVESGATGVAVTVVPKQQIVGSGESRRGHAKIVRFLTKLGVTSPAKVQRSEDSC